jgi:glucuronokinase
LIERDAKRLGNAMDENFDVRRRIFKLPSWQLQMIDVARGCGASANFAGSGGAIVGTHSDPDTFAALGSAFDAIDCCLLTPQVT